MPEVRWPHPGGAIGETQNIEPTEKDMRALTTFLTAGFLTAVVLMPAPAKASDESPVGYWKTIHDDGKTVKSIVQIYKQGDEFKGKIVKLINPDEPNPLCKECKGKLHNTPITGMVFLWGMKQDDDEWSGGRILDPENGEDYGCNMELKDGGKKLKVRGFVGLSLFGRTQIWLRTNGPE